MTLRLYPVVACSLSALLLTLFLFLLLAGCDTQTQASTSEVAANTIPSLLVRMDDQVYGDRAVIHPNQRIYFLGEDSVAIVAGSTLEKRLALPNLAPPYGQSLRDLGVEPASGLVYVLDNFTGAIHVISNTVVMTTLLGLVEQPLQIVADADSGELYIFYVAHATNRVEARVAILQGTQKIADIALPVLAKAALYNPADGHIYVAGNTFASDNTQRNALLVLDHHQVITTIQPLDASAVGVLDLAVNASTGAIYILLVTKIVYWDRSKEPQSLDLYTLGYKNLGCLTVDPKRGWAYVCSWLGQPSYVLAVNKDQLVDAIQVEAWPYAAAADTRHDYIYVIHHDPTYLSIIRETALITTLDIIGLGAMNVTVAEERGLIYTSNAGDGSISVYSFRQPSHEPTLWQRILSSVKQ